MIKAANPASIFPAICLIDSDVIINWLAKEADPVSNEELWEAPHKIMKLIEGKKINGFSALINLLEIRFVLRRKKNLGEDRIKKDIAKLLNLLEIIIPDEVILLKANSLQTDHPFSPFDAMLIAVGSSIPNAVLISRDKSLAALASKFMPTATPEEFLRNFNL